MRVVVALAVLAVLPSVGVSNTIWVPDDHPTIQEAIDAAVDGDEVIVRPGVYVELINFNGKAITVKSELGPDFTTIDGYGGTVVRFWSGEGLDSVIEGFTITNGECGISIWNCSPRIVGNVITQNQNHGDSDGGGIYCENSSAVIAGNVISDNEVDWFSGMGWAGYGGGIYCYEGSPVITGNLIRNNVAITRGGGVYLAGVEPSASIDNNIISECVAYDTHGASWGWGGGISCTDSSPAFRNNTITGCYAKAGGGGLYFDSSHSVLTSVILWDNGIESGLGPEVLVGPYGTPTISYSDVEGGLSSTAGPLNWGLGMIDADPLFIDPGNGDFRLQQDPCQPGVNNPCVDSGDPMSPMITGTTRIDLVQDSGVVDMGFHYDIPSIPGIPYCYGDPGSGTPCPCGNDNNGSVPGSGCASGAFAHGAQLTGSGLASVSADSLILLATRTEQNNTNLYFQADNRVNGGDGITFGDGLRCAGGNLIRLEVCTSNGVGMTITSVPIAIKGGVAPGDVKRYQCWYRNPTNSPCGSDFNLSNGYEITWLP